jgi:uncharacterized repeat protein (TIGR03943 family)
MKQRFNLEYFVQFLLLSFLFLVFDYLLTTNVIGMYLHPRFNPPVYVATVFLAFLCFWQLIRSFRPGKNRPIRLKYFTVLSIPLIFLLSPKQPIDASMASIRGASVDNSVYYNGANQPAAVAVDAPPKATEPNSPAPGRSDPKKTPLPDPARQLPLVADLNSFLPVLNEIFTNPLKYSGRTLRIDGWKFSTSEVAANRFIIARLGIFCCTADAQAVGIICQCADPKVVPNKGWFQFEGVIRVEKPSDRTDVDLEPYVDLVHFTPIKPPKDPYVYLNQY